MTSALLRSFLPTTLVPGADAAESMQGPVAGAVLLADISGFTPLAVSLAAAHGQKRGAEELTQIVGRVLQVLLDPVRSQRGLVASFQGDGILCCFPEALGEGAPGTIRRAVSAALQMVAAVSRAAVAGSSPDVPPLTVRVAVAQGPITRCVVGDPAIRLVDLVVGSPVERLALLSRAVRGGEVLVDAAAAHQATDVTFSRWVNLPGGGTAAIAAACDAAPVAALAELFRSDEDASRRWLPSSVFRRLERGEDTLVTELRPVAPIFLAFHGVDFAAPGAHGRLDGWVRHAQRVIHEVGGSIIDLSASDSGLALYAAVGALDTFEDTPFRAARAALECVRAVPAETVEGVRAAVTFGQARVGAVGSEVRRTWAVMGSEVNLAARLVALANPGDVLVSDRVARAAEGRLSVEPRGEVLPKGFTSPLRLHRVVSDEPSKWRTPRTDNAGALSGRVEELRTIDACLDEATSADHCVVLVMDGEPGVGKSRLTAELTERARRRGFGTYSGFADQIERAAPWHAWRGVLAELGDLETRTRAIDPELCELLPLLAGVTRVPAGETDRIRAFSDDARGEATQALLLRLLSSGADAQSRVIVLDDMHWADSASANLARLVAGQSTRTLLVVCRRTWREGMPVDARPLDEIPGARVLQLQPLADADIRHVLASSAGADSVSPAVSRALTRKVEGRPLFAVALTKSLLEQQVLAVRDGELVFTAPAGAAATTDLPDSIEAVLASRVDRLDEPVRLTLKVASVLGRTFRESGLRALYPPATRLPDLTAHLEALQRAGLVEPTKDNAWQFHHAITQDVVYYQMSESSRRTLHAVAAGWLEAEARQLATPPWALLAHHWQRAGDAERSRVFLDGAGHQALREGGYQEAVEHLEAARRLDGAWSHAQGQRLMALGRGYFRVGRHTEALTCAEEALAHLDRPVPQATPAVAVACVREIARQGLHRLMPGRFPGRAPAEQRDRVLHTVAQYTWYSEICFHLKRPAQSIYAAVRQLNIAERAGPSENLAVAYGTLCIICGLFGLGRVGRRYGDLAQATLQVIPASPALRAMVLHQINLFRLATGELREIQESQPATLEAFEKAGDRARMRDAGLILGTAQYFAADYAGARATLEVTRTAGPGEDEFTQLVAATCVLAGVACRTENWPVARHELETLGRQLKRVGGESIQSAFHGLRAREALARGDTATAQRAATEALDALARSGYVPLGPQEIDGSAAASFVAITLWEAATIAGRAREARELSRLVRRAGRALAMARRFLAVAEPALRLHRAQYAKAIGATDRARREAAAGLVAARRLGTQWEENAFAALFPSLPDATTGALPALTSHEASPARGLDP